MSDNQYYIPDELQAIHNEISTERSDHFLIFKKWWSKGVDSISSENNATQTKLLMSGFSDLVILRNELKDVSKAKLSKVRQKKSEIIKRIENIERKPLREKLDELWSRPVVLIRQKVRESIQLLSDFEADDPDQAFTTEEKVLHGIKRMQYLLEDTERMYAKYLGLAKLLSYYWDYGRLTYFEEAVATEPLVCEESIGNYSIRELINMGQRDDHAARIRFMFFTQSKI